MAFARWVGRAIIVGGVLWIVLRHAVASTWGQSLLGLTYEDWNRLMVAPLVLLACGSLGIGSRLRGPSRWATWLTAGAVAVSLVGVIVEFWWAGGLRGNREGAMLGWGLYLLGVLGQAIGLAALGGLVWRARAFPGWAAAAMLAVAALHVLWLPAIASSADALAAADQILIGVGWIVIGVAALAPQWRPQGLHSPTNKGEMP